MKILFASAYIPYPQTSGGRIRSYYLLRELCKRHETHLIALRHDARQGSLEPLLSICASVAITPAPRRTSGPLGRLWRLCFRPDDIVMSRRCSDLHALLHARLLDEHYDLLFLEELGAAPYLRIRDRPPTLLSKHNAEGLLLDRLAALKGGPSAARLLARMEAAAARRNERTAVRLADAVIVPSDADGRDLRGVASGRPILVVPNGVDTAHFRPQSHPADGAPMLLFCGALFWYPNVDAVFWFCREILPLIRARAPGVRLRIVGAAPPPTIRALQRTADVEVFGDVDDVRPHLAAATVCVAPLRAGAGSRLKNLEALAAGRAMVTTTVGAEGLDLSPGRDLLVADGPEAFAGAVLSVLTVPRTRTALECAGRATAEQRWDWSRVLNDLDRVCDDVAGRRL